MNLSLGCAFNWADEAARKDKLTRLNALTILSHAAREPDDAFNWIVQHPGPETRFLDLSVARGDRADPT